MENMSDIVTGLQDFGSFILTESNTVYNKTFYELRPDTDYVFQLRLLYNSTKYHLYHWPLPESGIQYIFRTLSKALIYLFYIHFINYKYFI